MKYGLSEEQLKQIQDIISSYDEIEEAILFGSRAMDTYKEASDVDIALKGKNVNASLAARLKYRLEEDTYLPFFFDFIAYPTITNQALKKHIDTKGVSIYRAGWKECKLGEVYDFASGLSKSRDEFGFGYGFLSFKDVFHNYFVPDELTELANTTEKERYRCSIKKGDVFLTRTSETQEELGMSCVALKDYPDATFNGFTKRLRQNDQKKVLPEFAGFYFRSPRFRTLVTSMASITTRASLNNDMLANLTIILPPLPEQKAIASVLSSLDEKIDLLHRQNKTLEAMSETLFRQWFVEEAQEDWEEKLLGNILTTIESGSRPKGGIDLDLKHGIPSIGAENINGLGNYNHGSTKYITLEYFERMKRGIVQDYDVLIYKDGAYIGKKSMFAKGFPFKKCAINEHVFILRTESIFLQLFLYFALEQEGLALLNANSAQPGLNQTSMKSFELLLPKSELIEMFGQTIMPLIDKIFFNGNQIRTLEKLRDILLPKLMSGEVRVVI